MDKYYGISKPETHSTSIEYRVISRRDADKKLKANKSRSDISFLIRCAVCVLIVAVCAIGKFTSIAAAQTASDFIKDELSRDSVAQLTEFIEEQLDK